MIFSSLFEHFEKNIQQQKKLAQRLNRNEILQKILERERKLLNLIKAVNENNLKKKRLKVSSIEDVENLIEKRFFSFFEDYFDFVFKENEIEITIYARKRIEDLSLFKNLFLKSISNEVQIKEDESELIFRIKK